jgi:hypothetical protein
LVSAKFKKWTPSVFHFSRPEDYLGPNSNFFPIWRRICNPDFIKEIPMKIAKKQVRIIKKIREASGVWRFISLQRAGSRYVWDDRPGHYFLDWREGRKRKREYAGGTPAEATESQRRKRNELLGAMISQGKTAPAAENHSLLTIARAREMFLDHVRAVRSNNSISLYFYTLTDIQC